MSGSSAVPAHARAIATKLAPLVSTGSGGAIDVTARSTPRQTNGFDCGVYVLAIAEWLCSTVAGAVGGSESAAATTDLNALDLLAPPAISAKRTAIGAIIRSLAGL
jgi:hypothetical protein